MVETTKVRVDDAKLVALIRDLERQGTPVRIVADGVEYGIFHEMGTVNLPQRPTLVPAVESNRDALERGMQQTGGDLTRVTTVVDKVAFDVLGDWQRNVRMYPVGDHIGLVDTGALLNSLHVVEPGTGIFDYEVDLKVSK